MEDDREPRSAPSVQVGIIPVVKHSPGTITFTLKNKNFFSSGGRGTSVMEQLTDFLNIYEIIDFKVVIMQDKYIEIVYKMPITTK